MRWLIKCPAPAGFSQRDWGDLHFARSLARQLIQRGHEVSIQNNPDWKQREDDADVVLVLRGKRRYVPRNKDAINVMWLMSHPASVTDEEIREFDLCCVASMSHVQRLRQRFGKDRIIPLLQCTDTRDAPETLLLPASERRDVIFVGNTRNVERWCVLKHLRAGYPLKIWGVGWERWAETQRCVVGEHVENERLGQLYGSARATLNDHWPDMIKYGFVNNRIFDALACGLPVISDYMPELDDIFGGGILYYHRSGSPAPTFHRLERDYLTVFDRVQALAECVATEHSFAARADELLSAVQQRRQQRTGFGPLVAMVLRRWRSARTKRQSKFGREGA